MGVERMPCRPGQCEQGVGCGFFLVRDAMRGRRDEEERERGVVPFKVARGKLPMKLFVDRLVG